MHSSITGLRLRNFKRFGDPGVRVAMAPVTLLFGANSTGKSSIIQALLLLAQSWAGPEENMMWLEPNGPLVQLGSFYNFRHRSSAEGHIPGIVSFGFELSDGMVIELEYAASKYEAPEQDERGVGRTQQGGLERVVFSTPAGERIELVHDWLTTEITWDEVWFTAGGNAVAALLGFDPIQVYDLFHHAYFRGLELGVTFTGTATDGARIHTAPMHTFEAPDRDNYNVDEDDIDDYYPTRADLSDIQQQYHERIEAAQERLRDLVGRLLQLRNLLLTDFTYVGPQREVGRYVYDLASGSEGTKLAATLGRRPEIVNKCNAMLRALEVPYAVHADILTTKMGTRLVEVLLEDLRSGPSEGVRKGLPNVGFGVTQLLYIVAALVEHGRGPDGVAPGDVRLPGFEKWPYLLVEQPELHLHPRWQANLASLFCGTAWPQRPDDETVFDRCNLILETHSEHLMLRLQRLVRNGKVAPGEVVINVLEQHDGSGTTKVTPIALAPDGELSVIWPGGFFTERDVELYG